MLRLGLERAATAREAVEVIAALLELHGQWGSSAQEGEAARPENDNSFLLADSSGEAWLLDTAGRQWAALRLSKGFRAASNELSIHTHWDLASAGVIDYAVEQGWWGGDDAARAAFDFTLAYGDHTRCMHGPRLRAQRAAQLLAHATAPERGGATLADLKALCRDSLQGSFADDKHANPAFPAHATLAMFDAAGGFTWGDTASSLVVRLPLGGGDALPPEVFLCLSHPCCGVYIPVPFGADGICCADDKLGALCRAGTVGDARTALAPPPYAGPLWAPLTDAFAPSSSWWRWKQLLRATKGWHPQRQPCGRIVNLALSYPRNAVVVKEVLGGLEADLEAEFYATQANLQAGLDAALAEEQFCSAAAKSLRVCDELIQRLGGAPPVKKSAVSLND